MFKVYSAGQAAAILNTTSITESKYGETVLGAFSNPKRLTLPDANDMGNRFRD